MKSVKVPMNTVVMPKAAYVLMVAGVLRGVGSSPTESEKKSVVDVLA